MAEAATFADLKFQTHRAGLGGVAARHTFDNGYGISVVRFPGSYGHESDLWEAAVLHDDKLCYDTPITSDVEGHLTESDVSDMMARVAALPAKVSA